MKKVHTVTSPPLAKLRADMEAQGEKFFDTTQTRREIDLKWGDIQEDDSGQNISQDRSDQNE